MSRGFLAAVTAACVALAPYALVDPAQASKNLNSSRSNIYRMGGGGGAKGAGAAAKTTTVKSSKSNTSDRMGGGGGVRGPAGVINLDSRPSSNY